MLLISQLHFGSPSIDKISSYLELVNKLVVILGLPLAYFQFVKANRKERRDREYGTYNALDEKYLEFQKLCLEYPYLDTYDISDNSPIELTEGQKKEELILFTMLFSIFERAYLLYSDQDSDIKKRQWIGWESYIKSYCRRGNFLKAWEVSGATFDTKFESYMREMINSTISISNNDLP